MEVLHQLMNKNAVELVKNQESLGFYYPETEVRTGPKQVFHFVDHGQGFTAKIQEILAGPTCPVWQLMSLIGLLTAAEK